MKRWVRLGVGLGAGAALVCVGCGPPPEARVRQDVQKVQTEREPDKLVARGRAFARIGDLTRAEQYLTAALDEGADPREVLPTLLRVCVQSGRYRAAIEHAENHLKAHPRDTALRYLLGTLLAAVDNPIQARVELEKVVQADPDHADAYYALAVLARDHEKDPVRADAHFRTYLRLRPTGPHADEARASLLRSVP